MNKPKDIKLDSWPKRFFESTIAITTFIVMVLIIKYTKDSSGIIWFFGDIRINHNHEKSYWIFLRSIAFQIGVFLFVHSIIIMGIRLYTRRSSPSTHTDPLYVKVLNRIIHNTIEQSFMFLPILIYFLYDGFGLEVPSMRILKIGGWFIWGRILYSTGYLLGIYFKQPALRSFGFSLSVFVNFFLLEHIFFPTAPISNFLLAL